MRIATYNIRLGLEHGLAAVADVLAAIDADLVALQEVGNGWIMGDGLDQTAWLADRLGYAHSFFVPTISAETRGLVPALARMLVGCSDACFGHAVLSRAPFSDGRVIELPRVDDEPRALLHIKLRLGGVVTDVVSGHLSHLDDERPAQLEALFTHLDRIAASGAMAIALGDFNEPVPAVYSAALAGRGFADSGAGPLTYPANLPAERRDVIWVRGVETTPPKTMATVASDHRPLWLDLAL